MDMPKEYKWINTPMKNDLFEKLDQMVMQDGIDRSKFIRILIMQEWEARKNRVPMWKQPLIRPGSR